MTTLPSWIVSARAREASAQMTVTKVLASATRQRIDAAYTRLVAEACEINPAMGDDYPPTHGRETAYIKQDIEFLANQLAYTDDEIVELLS